MRNSALSISVASLIVLVPLWQIGCSGDSGSTFVPGGPIDGGTPASDAPGSSDSAGFFVDTGASGSSSSGSSGHGSGSSSGSGSSGGVVHACTGCFDLNGKCLDGTTDNACGANGASCQDCTAFVPAQSCHGTQATGGACGAGSASSGSSSGATPDGSAD